jgi:hypothetical protein
MKTLYVVSGEYQYDGGKVLGITSTYEKGEKLAEEIMAEMSYPWDTIHIEEFEVGVRKQYTKAGVIG